MPHQRNGGYKICAEYARHEEPVEAVKNCSKCHQVSKIPVVEERFEPDCQAGVPKAGVLFREYAVQDNGAEDEASPGKHTKD